MTRENEILQFLHYHPASSRSEIETGSGLATSPATLKRILASLVEDGSALVSGKGRATRYSVSPQAHVTLPLDIDTYFQKETEKLLKEKQTASGKTKEEAVMLLNHKDALDFVLEDPEYLKEISVRRIEVIHSLLTKELNVDKGIRKRRVGITGTNYYPLDNEYQIREALEDSCTLINGKENVFEKALLSLVLLSYIQAFSDGNKRTARITGNAILIAHKYCPISFRTVDSMDYKKAMLIFYEQNNISAFKKIFIDQFAFAVQTYF